MQSPVLGRLYYRHSVRLIPVVGKWDPVQDLDLATDCWWPWIDIIKMMLTEFSQSGGAGDESDLKVENNVSPSVSQISKPLQKGMCWSLTYPKRIILCYVSIASSGGVPLSDFDFLCDQAWEKSCKCNYRQFPCPLNNLSNDLETYWYFNS